MTFSSMSKVTGFEIQTRGILYVTNSTPPPPLRWPDMITIKQTYFSTSPHALCGGILLSDTDMLPLPFPLLQ